MKRWMVFLAAALLLLTIQARACLLYTSGLLEKQPERLRQTAALRVSNPELTLSELAEEFDPPVTKSCLNHRLRKLMELAKNL